MEDGFWVVWLLAAAAVGLIILGCVFEYQASQDCAKRGGNWTVVGQSVSVSKYGATVSPIYGCVGGK
jgi:hypothetical protein